MHVMASVHHKVKSLKWQMSAGEIDEVEQYIFSYRCTIANTGYVDTILQRAVVLT